MDVGGTYADGCGRYLRQWMGAALALMDVGGTYVDGCGRHLRQWAWAVLTSMDVDGTCVNGCGRYLHKWMWAVLTSMDVGGTYNTVCVTEYGRHVLFHERLVTVGVAYLPVRCDAIVTGVAFEFVAVVLNARRNPRCT